MFRPSCGLLDIKYKPSLRMRLSDGINFIETIIETHLCKASVPLGALICNNYTPHHSLFGG